MRYRRLSKYLTHSIKYLTPSKMTNYLKYRSDLRNREVVTTSFPPQIAFQPSAYCNSNCQLCPVGLKMTAPEKGFLKFDDFRLVLDSTKKYLMRIDFGDWGEPFLNPDIFDMIKYAESCKVMTAASTNLHWFKDRDDLKKIIDSGLSFLTISLHGVSQESYNAYQPGKSFEQAIEKTRHLVDLKKEFKKSEPIIDLVFAITKKNQHEVAKMPEFAKKLGVDTIIYPASLNLRFYIDNMTKLTEIAREWAPDTNIMLHDTSAFGKDRATRLYKAVLYKGSQTFIELDREKLSGRHYCIDPWRSLVVNWDGTVSLCCVDYIKYIMGDTRSQTLIKIWNNENYQTVRKYLLDKLDNGFNFPCKKCIIY